MSTSDRSTPDDCSDLQNYSDDPFLSIPADSPVPGRQGESGIDSVWYRIFDRTSPLTSSMKSLEQQEEVNQSVLFPDASTSSSPFRFADGSIIPKTSASFLDATLWDHFSDRPDSTISSPGDLSRSRSQPATGRSIANSSVPPSLNGDEAHDKSPLSITNTRTSDTPNSNSSCPGPMQQSNNFQLRPRITRAKSRRACIACLRCRKRRVRCDVATGGSPCTNCKADDMLCTTEPRKRGRRRTITQLMHEQVTPQVNSRQSLYNLSKVDMDLLRSKGVFDLPPIAVQEDFLKTFFRFVYWQIPTMTMDGIKYLVECSIGRDRPRNMLLFYAVLTSAAEYVSDQVVNEAGFSSQSLAREIMLERCRVLYNMICEQQLDVQIQAILCLALVSRSSAGLKGCSHWVAIAVSLCYREGLHRPPSHDFERRTDEKVHRCNRRLWWSCFVLDQITAVREKRIPFISNEDWHVAIPDLDDFGLHSLQELEHPDDYQDVIFNATCFLEKAHLSKQAASSSSNPRLDQRMNGTTKLQVSPVDEEVNFIHGVYSHHRPQHHL